MGKLWKFLGIISPCKHDYHDTLIRQVRLEGDRLVPFKEYSDQLKTCSKCGEKKVMYYEETVSF